MLFWFFIGSFLIGYFNFFYSSSWYIQEVVADNCPGEMTVRVPPAEQPELTAAEEDRLFDPQAWWKHIFNPQMKRYVCLLGGSWLIHLLFFEPILLALHLLIDEPKIGDVEDFLWWLWRSPVVQCLVQGVRRCWYWILGKKFKRPTKGHITSSARGFGDKMLTKIASFRDPGGILVDSGKVTFALALRNLPGEFTDESNSDTLALTRANMKETIAEEAGEQIEPKDVAVQFKPFGNATVATVTIELPGGVRGNAVAATLRDTQPGFCPAVAAKINDTYGINQIATAEVVVELTNRKVLDAKSSSSAEAPAAPEEALNLVAGPAAAAASESPPSAPQSMHDSSGAAAVPPPLPAKKLKQ
jgi:hypothetical protein